MDGEGTLEKTTRQIKKPPLQTENQTNVLATVSTLVSDSSLISRRLNTPVVTLAAPLLLQSQNG